MPYITRDLVVQQFEARNTVQRSHNIVTFVWSVVSYQLFDFAISKRINLNGSAILAGGTGSLRRRWVPLTRGIKWFKLRPI